MAGFVESLQMFLFMAMLAFQIQSTKSDTLSAANSPVIAVVLKSLTIRWTYQSEKTPLEVSIYVREIGPVIELKKIWSIKYESGTATKNKIDAGLFQNNTELTNEGSKAFQLSILSVPKDIESFAFTCRVNRGMWSTALEKEVNVKIASPPIIDFNVRNSNGNSTAGGALEMACAARGYPDPRVTIKKETSTVPITLTSGLLNATFSVAQLKASDSGKYICIAENVASVVRKEVVVTVKYKPVATLTVSHSDKDITVGTTLTMVCGASGYPEPTLVLQRFTSGGWLEIDKSKDNITYILSNIQPEASGKYSCAANNIAGTSSIEKQISVLYIKSVASSRQDLLEKINSEVLLTCNVTGHPKPLYTWYKEKKVVTSSGQKLRVQLKRDDDFGGYSCEAVNPAGKRTIAFSITKTYIEKSSGTQTKIDGKIGETKRLVCPIRGHPKVAYTWLKEKVKLSDSRNLVVLLDKKEKFGSYMCITKNDAGEETVLFTLKQNPTKEERQTRDSSAVTLAFDAIFALVIVIACYANT
ncbi:hemicentin-1-like [Rhopilema esculentum]|uniref:hemicentin-1-like n=1 Tax=Rhopilema esculentum TaxID=499914 RepID=UPI0031E43632